VLEHEAEFAEGDLLCFLFAGSHTQRSIARGRMSRISAGQCTEIGDRVAHGFGGECAREARDCVSGRGRAQASISSPPLSLLLLPAGATLPGWDCLPLGNRAFDTAHIECWDRSSTFYARRSGHHHERLRLALKPPLPTITSLPAPSASLSYADSSRKPSPILRLPSASNVSTATIYSWRRTLGISNPKPRRVAYSSQPDDRRGRCATKLEYLGPKPGTGDRTPVRKISFIRRIGELGCGVGYYP
jgi:hypothetical protein